MLGLWTATWYMAVLTRPSAGRAVTVGRVAAAPQTGCNSRGERIGHKDTQNKA